MEKYRVRSRWVKMLSRCEDEDNPDYRDYGGRGITVCDDWREFSNFYAWVIANGIESEKQLDRLDNSDGYSPENCRFVSRSQNGRNKRNNVLLTAFGETKTMIEWSEDARCVVSYSTLLIRILRNWGHEEALILESNSTRKGKTPHNVVTMSAFGESKTIPEWVKDSRCLVNRQTLWARLNRGWMAERALSTPARKNTK